MLSFGLFGCATVNFSSKYYTLPEDYRKDIDAILTSARIPIRAPYKPYICLDKCDSAASGIPYTDGTSVYLPKTFLQYVYEFYYNDRAKIILCTYLHEVTHNEFGIGSKPPEAHYLCDKAVIERFFNNGNNSASNVFYTPSDLYSSLLVIQDYWRARKGLGGHLFNIGWNALNAVSLFYGGSGSIGDLYAVDIATRIQLMRRDYPSVKFVFKRSHKNDAITSLENTNLDSISSAKIIPEEKPKSKAEEASKKLNRWFACKSIRLGLSEIEVKNILGEPDSIKLLPQTASTHNEINPFYPFSWIYKDNLRVEFRSTNGKEYRVSSWACSELKN